MIAIAGPSGGLSLRISVTDRCQMRCRYCMPPDGIEPRPREEILSYEEIAALAALLRDAFGLAKIRITGGEPLARPRLERLIEMLAALGVLDLAVTTNGLWLEERAAALKRAGLRRVNVSLDALTPTVFERITGRGDVRRVIRGIEAARNEGLTPVKLNAVVVRGINDGEITGLVDFAIEHDCEIRFIELMPMGPGADLYAAGHVPNTTVREMIAQSFSMTPIGRTPGASALRYRVADRTERTGVVGFISPCSAPFCADCTRLRVTADGRLLGCLARDGGLPIREMLRRGDLRGVAAAAAAALCNKRDDAIFTRNRTMASVGG